MVLWGKLPKSEYWKRSFESIFSKVIERDMEENNKYIGHFLNAVTGWNFYHERFFPLINLPKKLSFYIFL